MCLHYSIKHAYIYIYIYVCVCVCFITYHVHTHTQRRCTYIHTYTHVSLSFPTSLSLYIYIYMLYSHLHIYMFLQHHNDTIIKTHDKDAEGRRRMISLRTFYLSVYCKGSKGLLKLLHVRGCWRPKINFIFWPHCYDRQVVSFLFSWCWGLLHRGIPRGPSVWCGLPYNISSLTLWESAGNCFGGFPSAPSVGCGFPYHIWSLAVWDSTGNCSGTQTQLS